MELLSGIKLYLDNPLSIRDRILINSGSRSINGKYLFFENLYFKYKDNAFIPKNNWRQLNPLERKKLLNSNESLNKNFIEVGMLPIDIIESIRKLNLHDSISRKEVFSKFQNNLELVRDINYKINIFLNKIAIEKDFEFYKIVVFPENVISNGISKNDNGENVFLGMHIDRSTDFEIETASFSRNRICINISNEARELHIINLSLLQIKNILNRSDLNTSNITDIFFNSPLISYPVLKLKIEPYEYYIAPTDNYIHDGTTMNRKHPDITLTYLGNFKSTHE